MSAEQYKDCHGSTGSDSDSNSNTDGRRNIELPELKSDAETKDFALRQKDEHDNNNITDEDELLQLKLLNAKCNCPNRSYQDDESFPLEDSQVYDDNSFSSPEVININQPLSPKSDPHIESRSNIACQSDNSKKSTRKQQNPRAKSSTATATAYVLPSKTCDKNPSSTIDHNNEEDNDPDYIHCENDLGDGYEKSSYDSGNYNNHFGFSSHDWQQVAMSRNIDNLQHDDHDLFGSKSKLTAQQPRLTELNQDDLSETKAAIGKAELVNCIRQRKLHHHDSQSDHDGCQPLEPETDTDQLEKCLGSILNRSFKVIKNTFDLIRPSRMIETCYFYPSNTSKNQSTFPSTQARQRDKVEFDRQEIVNMPNQHTNRYQSFDYYDEPHVSRKIRSKNRTRDFQRLSSASLGFSKLSYQQLEDNPKQSAFLAIERFLILLLMVLISLALIWKIYQALTEVTNYLGVTETESVLGHFSQYAVSTDASPCASVGKNLLAKGGSAVDATIGTLICMGIVIPNSLGLGGGCLMTIYNSKFKNATVIDGREEAPDYATEDMFVDNPLQASRGPLSIGVPGELAAYWKAHKMFGKLNWSELFDENIELAEYGVPTMEHLAYALDDSSHSQYLSDQLAKVFTNPRTGDYLKEGDRLVQKQLAKTLKRLQVNGASEFYGGLTGKLFIEDLKKQGGKLTMENLIKYEAIVREPLQYKLAEDLHLYTQPLPGSGVILGVIMRIMKKLGYYKSLKPQESFDASSLYYHRLAEAFKIAYAQRAGLEDKPDDENRLQQLMNKLMSEEFIESSANMIDFQAHHDNRYGGNEFFSEDHGTAHVSVIDADGLAVAVTSSVNLYFGSGLMSESTGIVYNDVMDDFVSPNITNKFGLRPSEYNHIKPGRRPLSSMAPSVFTDANGNVKLILGASGGAKITTSIASVSLRNLYLGDDLKTSIDGPRIHHQYLPDEIAFEDEFPGPLLQSLHDRGHKLKPIVGRSSVVMGIAVDYDEGNLGSSSPGNINPKPHITANSDYRKGGRVDGV